MEATTEYKSVREGFAAPVALGRDATYKKMNIVTRMVAMIIMASPCLWKRDS
jgi:hypothetical protein